MINTKLVINLKKLHTSSSIWWSVFGGCSGYGQRTKIISIDSYVKLSKTSLTT